MEKDELDAKIEGTPFSWRQALTQGKTGKIAIPTPAQHDAIVKQANALSSVYYLLGGFVVTSWLRTPEHNTAVGGASASRHLFGDATDFIPLHITPTEARIKIKQSGVYPGRTELDATTWCHYDLKNGVDFYARTPGIPTTATTTKS